MVLRTLFGCSPFVACGLVSAFTEWRTGTLVAVLLAVVLMAVALRGGVESAVVEISAVVFCGAAAVIAFAAPHLVLREFIGALSSGWLAVTAWGSVALGRPFTKAPERRAVPAEVWRHPLFHRTHAAVTSIWALGFTATAVLLAVVETEAPHSGFVETLIQLAGNVVPAVFAHRYLTRRPDGMAAPRPETATGT